MEQANTQRMVLVLVCYDRLPLHLRYWISNLHFSLHDDHILRGAIDVEKCKQFIESGGAYYEKLGNGQN